MIRTYLASLNPFATNLWRRRYLVEWVRACLRAKLPIIRNLFFINNKMTHICMDSFSEIIKFLSIRECRQTCIEAWRKAAYLARSHSRGLRLCLHRVTITSFIQLLPLPMFWFLLKVLCQCPPSRVPLPCMLIELCIFYYCCQGKIRDTFSKRALRGQWTQRGVLLLLHYQSSLHLNGAGLWTFLFPIPLFAAND